VLVAVAMIVRSVPNSREHTEHRFDTIGSATSVLAVPGLIFALHEGPVPGWTEPATVIGLVGGTLAAVAFAVWEFRQMAPLIDVRLFGERGLTSGSVALLAVFGVRATIFVVNSCTPGLGPQKINDGTPSASGTFTTTITDPTAPLVENRQPLDSAQASATS